MADNKKYYYLKLKENFFDSDEIILLESMPDGYLYSNILLKLYLRSLKNEGRLMFNDRIPYSPQMLSSVTRHQIGTVEKALQIFQQLGLIEVMDSGAIYLMDIQNFIGTSSTEADRQRAYQKRIKEEKGVLPESSEESRKKSNRLPNRERKEPRKESNRIPTPEIEIEKELELESESEKEQESESEKETEEKALDKASAPVPNFDETTFSDLMVSKVEEWLTYKKERREGYKPTGLKNLISEIQNNVTRYGEQPVMDLISTCMANNWRGIIFERLRGLPEARQSQIQPGHPGANNLPDTNNEFARLAQKYRGVES